MWLRANDYVFEETFFVYVFDETFFFVFTFLTKLFFLFLRSFLAKTFFYLAKLHLVKNHFANFILRNFISHRLATPIHSLALAGSTLATPVALIFLNGWTDRQTDRQTDRHTHACSIIIDYIIINI